MTENPVLRILEVPLNPLQGERLFTVAGDLELIAELSSGKRLPTHAEVRVMSAILRRLICEDELAKAWKPLASFYGKFVISAPDLDATVACLPRAFIQQAWSGGASVEGMAGHKAFVIWRIPENERPNYPQVTMTRKIREFTIGELAESASLYVNVDDSVEKVRRGTVIKYCANRRGGVHLDPVSIHPPKREKKGVEYQECRVLNLDIYKVGHLRGYEFEILSIAQCLASARQAGIVISAAKETFPHEFNGDPLLMRVRMTDGTWDDFRFNPRPADEGTES